MVVYQKFGVMGLSVIFSILQKLKFQIFRLFILYDNCKNSSDCMNSTSFPNKTATVFEEESLSEFLYHSLLVNNCISVLPCIFLAAWSDKHGRKLLLALPFVGSFITDIILTILTFVPLASRSALLLAEAIYGIFGGTVLISIGCMCYITDATDHRLRTWFIGLYLGLLNTVPALDWIIRYYCTPLETGLTFQTLVLFAISIRTFFSVIFVIYIKKCVTESVFILGSFEGNPWMNLLTPINVSDTVSCVFRRRFDNMRSFIIVATVIFAFYNTSLNGNLSIFPRYFRNEYEWSYKDLLIFAIIFYSSQTVLLWVSTFFALNLRAFDADLGTYGSISLSVSCLVLSLAKSYWIALSGAATGIASLLIPTSILSILSKLIESTEIGCIYAGVGFLMLVTQLISVPAYEALEELCIEAGAPQVVFLLSFGLITFGLLFFVYLRKVIPPELLGQLDSSECLALINRKGQIEQVYT